MNQNRLVVPNPHLDEAFSLSESAAKESAPRETYGNPIRFRSRLLTIVRQVHELVVTEIPSSFLTSLS